MSDDLPQAQQEGPATPKRALVGFIVYHVWDSSPTLRRLVAEVCAGVRAGVVAAADSLTGAAPTAPAADSAPASPAQGCPFCHCAGCRRRHGRPAAVPLTGARNVLAELRQELAGRHRSKCETFLRRADEHRELAREFQELAEQHQALARELGGEA